MAVAQAFLQFRLLKFGKYCAVILIAYCIYLSAGRFSVHLQLRTSPENTKGYSTLHSNNVNEYKDNYINKHSRSYDKFGNTTESVQAIAGSPEMSHSDLNFSAADYLSPLNVLTILSAKNDQSIATRKRFGDMFRSGFVRTTFITEDGQKAWLENGVVFRPIRRDLNLMSNRGDIKLHHPSDFEYYVPFDEEKFFQGFKRPSGQSIKPKIIVWRRPLRYFGFINKPRPLRLCPEFPCHMTTNRDYEANSSAMVFEGSLISDDAPKRDPDQVFIFHHTETPLSLGYLKNSFLTQRQWRGAFNWTMSFRLDSDIPSPYGLIRKRTEPLEKDYTNLVARKTKLVASIISHCNTSSKRELYIKKLKEFVQVDIFGKCGTKCLRGDTTCGERIASQYKFYLAFENSLCEDYVTEKFFRYFPQDTIIITRGGSGYFKHAPPEIFINTADFKSPEELAKRLIYLDDHPKEYEAMLREKDKYVSMFEAYYHVNNGRIDFEHHHYEAIPFCRVCHWLWTLDSHRKRIPDIKAWVLNSSCVNPSDF